MKINRHNTIANIQRYRLIDTKSMQEVFINDYILTQIDVEEINKYLHNNLNSCLTDMLYLLVKRAANHLKRYKHLQKNTKYMPVVNTFKCNVVHYMCPDLLINFKKTKNKNEVKLNISVFVHKESMTLKKPLKKINPVYIPNIVLKDMPEALQKIGIYTALIPYIEKILQENAEKYVDILGYTNAGYNANNILNLFKIDNTNCYSINPNIKMSKSHTKQIRITIHGFKTLQYVWREINA